MRLALVTTCRDPGSLLRDTIASVFAQRVPTSSDVLIDYAIVDAASSDGTPEYLRTLDPPPWLRLQVVSEPDEGLYDGLWKGFGLVQGDWYGWLNAGDLLGPGCHRALSLAHGTTADVDWVTGLQVLYAESGDVLSATVPQRFRGDLLRRGLYGRTALPFVQQESTFWSDRLMRTVPERFRTFRLAGDLWLWSHLAAQLPDQRFPLAVLRAHLGGFRAHRDHLGRAGGGRDAYLDEAARTVGPVRRTDHVRGWFEARRWAAAKHPWKRRRQRSLLVTSEQTDLVRLSGRPLLRRAWTRVRHGRLGTTLGRIRRSTGRIGGRPAG